MTKGNVTFILHKPQLSENIGACARGIKNFGFNKLVLIDPKPLFPNDKIIATSVGAKDIIKKSKVYETARNLKIDLVIALDVPNKNLINRLLERGKTSGRTDDQSKEKI